MLAPDIKHFLQGVSAACYAEPRVGCDREFGYLNKVIILGLLGYHRGICSSVTRWRIAIKTTQVRITKFFTDDSAKESVLGICAVNPRIRKDSPRSRA